MVEIIKLKRKTLKKTIIAMLLVATVLVTPMIVIYFLNNGNPYHRYLVNKYIPKHLEEQGYSDSDIAEQRYVDPKHTLNRKVYHGHYLVVFKDEPELQYFYGVTKFKKDVVQFCEKSGKNNESVTEKTHHSESECIDQFDKS